ncbi:hypothetical protein COP2_030828 [Malus domestica]
MIFYDDFDGGFAVHSLCSCGPRVFGAVCSFNSCRQGAFVVTFYARADQERLLSPFMLVRTRSVDVAFYARADQELGCPAV